MFSATEPRESVNSVKLNAAWNLFGLGVYSISQWILIVVIARNAAESAGELAVALGIATPTFLILGLNLSILQAVENDDSNFRSHLAIRILVLPVGLAVSVLVVLLLGASSVTTVAIAAFARWIEGFSNGAYGVFLAKGQLRFLGLGMALRGTVGLFLGLLAWSLSGSVSLTLLALGCGWAVGVVVLELPAAVSLLGDTGTLSFVEVRRLVRRGLPLGLDSGANSTVHQGPRLMISQMLGEAALGRYVPVVQLAQYVTVAAGSLGSALLSKFAEHWRAGNSRKFRVLLAKVLFLTTPLVTAFAIVTGLAGPAVVRTLLGAEFVDHDLIWATGGLVGVITLQRLVSRALQAIGSFSAVLKVDVVVMSVSLIASWRLIPVAGAAGAAIGTAIGFGVGLILVVAIVRRSLSPLETVPQ